MRARLTGAPRPELEPQASGLAWHTLSVERVLRAEEVDAQRGLSSAEAAARAGQIVLLTAGALSLFPIRQLGTGLLLILLTLGNAVLGLHQEGKAEAAVTALQKMMIITARVRRDGQQAEIPAGQLVPAMSSR